MRTDSGLTISQTPLISLRHLVSSCCPILPDVSMAMTSSPTRSVIPLGRSMPIARCRRLGCLHVLSSLPRHVSVMNSRSTSRQLTSGCSSWSIARLPPLPTLPAVSAPWRMASSMSRASPRRSSSSISCAPSQSCSSSPPPAPAPLPLPSPSPSSPSPPPPFSSCSCFSIL